MNEIAISNDLITAIFDKKRFFLKRLEFKEEKIFIRSGIEFGDWRFFFSQEEKKTALKGEIVQTSIGPQFLNSKWEIKINTGYVEIFDNFKLNSNSLARNTIFNISEGTLIGDLVQRWSIDSPTIFVNKNIIQHESKKLYNEEVFENKEKKIDNINLIRWFKEKKKKIEINIILKYLDDRNNLFYKPYILDTSNNSIWIIHNRLKCLKGDEYFVRGCKTWYNKPLPEILSKIILKIPTLKKNLMYIREKKIPNFPIQAMSNKKFIKNEKFEFITEMQFVEENSK